MMTQQFLEILFPDRIAPGDLVIIEAASHNRPGRARLHLARIGEVDPGAPKSQPVLSHNGGETPSVGYVARLDLLGDGPFGATYFLQG